MMWIPLERRNRINHIAWMEGVSLIRDRRFVLATCLYVAMVLLSGAFAWIHYHSVESERVMAQAAERERWLEQDDKHPHAAAHFGFYAFRPVGPLGWVESGVNPFLGTTTWLEAHRQNEVSFRPVDDGGSMQRFGVLNLATVLTVFAPLLLILIFYDRISGEKERQTLPLLICQGVTSGDLYWGKFLAGAVVATGYVIVAMLAMALLLASSEHLLWSVRTLGVGAVLVTAYWLFLMIFVALTLAVSALARSSLMAMGVLLAFWMIGFLVAPRVFNDWAARSLPAPTRFEFQMALQEDLDDRSRLRERLDEEESRLLAKYGVDDTNRLPVNFRAVRLQFGEEHGYEVHDRHYGRLFDRFEAQNRWVGRRSWLSPAVAVRQIGMAMAGTDFRHYRNFVEEAEDYRRSIQKIMNMDLYENPETDGEPYLAGRELWEKVPPWDMESPEFWSLFRGLGAPASALFGWALVLPFLGRLATRRLFLRP